MRLWILKHKLMFNANEGEEGERKRKKNNNNSKLDWRQDSGWMNQCWRATPHRGRDYSVTWLRQGRGSASRQPRSKSPGSAVKSEDSQQAWRNQLSSEVIVLTVAKAESCVKGIAFKKIYSRHLITWPQNCDTATHVTNVNNMRFDCHPSCSAQGRASGCCMNKNKNLLRVLFKGLAWSLFKMSPQMKFEYVTLSLNFIKGLVWWDASKHEARSRSFKRNQIVLYQFWTYSLIEHR